MSIAMGLVSTYSSQTKKRTAASLLGIMSTFVLLQPAKAQSLSWSSPYQNTTTKISGLNLRPTPAAVVFNGSMFVAYTSNNSANDPSGNNYVYFGGCNGVTCGPFAYINPQGNTAAATTNPSMATFYGELWLAFNSAIPTGSYETNIVTSTTGANWSAVKTIPGTAGTVDSSPSLATDGTYLYVGLRDQATKTMTLCKTNGASAFTCKNFASTNPQTMGFNPGLAFYKGVLYAVFPGNDSHDIYYYTSTDQGATFTESTALLSTQSSCALHLAVHNGVLWVDGRTNDGDQKFLQRYTTDGSTWSNGSDPGIAMNGEPEIVDGVNINNPQNGGYLYNFFSSDNSSDYLTVSRGH